MDVSNEICCFIEHCNLHNSSCEDENAARCFARIIALDKSDKSEEPSWLSYPNQPFPFVIGPETITLLYGKSVVEIFDFIGYERSFLKSKLDMGTRYYLVFFSGYKAEGNLHDQDGELSAIDEPSADFAEHHSTPLPATWFNLMNLIAEFSSACAAKILPFLPILMSKPYDSYEFSIENPPIEILCEVNSFESFANSKLPNSPSLARAFLRHTMKCTKLYAGDGYSYDELGNRGAREYLMPRVKLENLINNSKIFHLTDHFNF